MEINTDLRRVLNKEHEQKWVAVNLQQTMVLDFDQDLIQLRNRLGADNLDVTYTKVLSSDEEYAF